MSEMAEKLRAIYLNGRKCECGVIPNVPCKHCVASVTITYSPQVVATEGDRTPEISQRKAFWVGLALLPVVIVVSGLAFVYGFVRFKVLAPLRRTITELGDEWLRDQPWK